MASTVNVAIQPSSASDTPGGGEQADRQATFNFLVALGKSAAEQFNTCRRKVYETFCFSLDHIIYLLGKPRACHDLTIELSIHPSLLNPQIDPLTENRPQSTSSPSRLSVCGAAIVVSPVVPPRQITAASHLGLARISNDPQRDNLVFCGREKAE